MLGSQVQLLCQWEPHAKRHFEAVATLGRFLGAVYLLLPLVEGAKVHIHSNLTDSTFFPMKSHLKTITWLN